MPSKKILLPSILVLIFFLSCNNVEQEERIMTVNGAIFSSDLGVTLIHEHVLVDWIGADSTGYHRWDRTEVLERVLPFFIEVAGRGVDTIGEFTPAYLGRDPYILSELSRRTGINILTNTGFYGAVDNRFMPAYAYDETSAEIAERWILEFKEGIDGSEVRPGFLKISVAEHTGLSSLHQKIVEAAAITHLETGMTIFSHTIGDEPARGQVELLGQMGVDPSAWVWTHAQSGSLDANITLAGKGAWISLDNVMFDPARGEGQEGSIGWYVDRIISLRDAGHLDKVLISHDAGWYDVGEPNGGDFRGYTDIFDYLISELIDSGLSDEDIEQLLVKNPARVFSLRVKKGE
ncbi:MAG: phosphotriesterase [Balneolaceae bacterium]|nr:MAG: phosphotriesterase [Balneolaceae bacterium]